MYIWHSRFIIIVDLCVIMGIVVLNNDKFLDVCIHMYFSNATNGNFDKYLYLIKHVGVVVHTL
jgi:hypothetical protein